MLIVFTDSDRPNLQPHPGGDVHGTPRSGRLLQWGETTSYQDKRHRLFSHPTMLQISQFFEKFIAGSQI